MVIYYDLDPLDQVPGKGDYLVSVGKKGIGSVWRIQAVRLVKQKLLQPFNRYSVTVLSMPELKPFTVLKGDLTDPRVWVRGEEAFPLVWYPRNKKEEIHL